MISKLQSFIILLSAITAQGIKGQEERSAPDSAIFIDEVTVSAYNSSGKIHTTPGSISVITANELNAYGGISLANVLSTVPGISMQVGTPVTSRLVIRGMGSRTPYNTNRIRAYLNDVPLTSSDGISTPEEIDGAALGRIEITKGPASAIYGSGLGGSINMFTPEETENILRIQSQYGSFNTAKLNVSANAKAGKHSLWGSIGHLNSSGFRENNDYKRTSFMSATKYNGTGWSLNSTLLLMGVKGGIPSSLGKTMFEEHPEQAAPSWKLIKGYEEYFKGLVSVKLTNYLTGTVSSQLVLFGKLNDNFERRPFNDLDDISLSGGMRYRLTYRSGRTELISGAEVIPEQYRWKLKKDSTLINSNSELRKQLSLFSILNYELSGNLNISMAAALNRITYSLTDRFLSDGDQSGKRSFPVIFSPRIGLNYSTSAYFSAYISASHGFSMPSPEETLLPEGRVNPDLKPEKGFQYEAGIRLNSSNKTSHLDMALYWIELNDLLVTKRITEDIFTGINAGKTRHTGLEISFTSLLLRKEVFPGSLIAVMNYTGSVNRFINFSDNNIVYDGKSLPGIPKQNLNLLLTWKPWLVSEMTARITYNGPQYITDDNSVRYPGYALLGIKASARIKMKPGLELILSAALENVTDKHYASMIIVNAPSLNNSEPRYYYPGLPRSFSFALQLEF